LFCNEPFGLPLHTKKQDFRRLPKIAVSTSPLVRSGKLIWAKGYGIK